MTTRGRGPLTPTRFERDAIIQLWVDRRDLAAVGTYMESQGVRLRHMSDILRFCVDNITEIIRRREPSLKEIDTAKATQFLENRLGVELNYGNRGKKNFVNNLLLSQTDEIPNISHDTEIFHSKRAEGIKMPTLVPGHGYTEEDIAELKRQAREQIGLENVVEDKKE